MNDHRNRTLLILILPQEWKTYHRRPHWEAISQHSKVLVVEPPAGILTAWLRPRRLLDYFKKDRKIRKQSESIMLFRPIQLVSPGVNFLFPLFSIFDRFWMKRQIKKVLKRIQNEFDTPVSFLSQVQQYHFSKLIPGAVQCYEIFDLYVIPYGHHKLDDSHWYTRRARKRDAKITDESDMVVTSSRLIYDQLKPNRDNVHYLHNSADYGHFSKSANSELEIPDEMKMIPRPIFGFIGYMNHLIDYELISKLAQSFRESSIVMIGAEQKITNVTGDKWYQVTKSLSNVYYLGFKDYETLPNYLKSFDICLMPFRLNDWMRYSAPNKTYQYLSSGKPVVSTNFTETESVRDVVYVADGHEMFIKMCGEALNENNLQLRTERQKIARVNSTENRAVKMMTILNDFLEKRN